VGNRREGKTRSGGTVLVLFAEPFVLYEFTMVNLNKPDRKNPSGVKKSRAMMSPVSKKQGRTDTVESKESRRKNATRGLDQPVGGKKLR